MSYKSWRPSSRRDRRRQAHGARGRRAAARGTDRSMLLYMGIFAVAVIALLIGLAIATR